MRSQSAAFPSTLAIPRPSLGLRRRAKRLLVRLAKFMIHCADCYSAAVQYEGLARLSDAELERRGFARGDLHRHVAGSLKKHG